MLLYSLAIRAYYLLIKFASLFNSKASAWIHGRKLSIEYNSSKKTVWFHCASLGEYEQGRSVLRALKLQYPDYHYLVSFFSPSGYHHVQAENEFDQKIYIPLDLKSNARKWIPKMNICLAVWVKNDFWYNHLQVLSDLNIPYISLSTIVRQDHFYLKDYGKRFRNLLKSASCLFVQEQNSFEHLENAGFNNIAISGDTRVDQIIELSKSKFVDSTISAFKGNSKLLVLASTHEEDDLIYMPLISKFLKDYKIIIAPHDIHAKRLEQISSKLKISYLSYSSNPEASELNLANVLILDNIGKLSRIYQHADVVYVGGGFGKGIHNIIEPAINGIPIFFGPKHTAFNEALYFIEHHLAFQITRPEDFESSLLKILQSDQLDYIKNGLFNYFKIFGGGTLRVKAFIEDNGILK